MEEWGQQAANKQVFYLPNIQYKVVSSPYRGKKAVFLTEEEQIVFPNLCFLLKWNSL